MSSNLIHVSLAEAIEELDNANANDDAYRQLFSTFAKLPLRKNETWRDRTIAWMERERHIAENNGLS